jgi:hypothetical protein
MNEFLAKDNGYRSRKLVFSVFSVATMVATWWVAGRNPALVPMYDTLVGGIVAVAGLYLAGSVGAKLVATKAPPSPVAAKKQVMQRPVEQVPEENL